MKIPLFFVAFVLPSFGYLLPSESAPNLSIAERVSDILQEKLSPITDALKDITRRLNERDSKSPRFTQLNGDLGAASTQLSQSAKDSLSSLIEMFRNKEAVASVTPPGTPTLTPEKLSELIVGAMSRAPEVDKTKLENMLNVWKNQMADYSNFMRLPMSGNQLMQQTGGPIAYGAPPYGFWGMPASPAVGAAPLVMTPMAQMPVRPTVY